MIKTLLVLTGAVLLAVPALHAQNRHFAAARSGLSRGYGGYRGGYGYRHGGHYGRYYYFGGVPYFYPFFGYGYGFGYPGYYDGFYGDGVGGPYGYGPDYGVGGAGGGYGAYEGRIVNKSGRDDASSAPAGNGGSLPEAVQRQLAKKGYYKGSVDGQFGPESRGALSRYQREHNLKETGRIDENTLDSLGFTDHQ